METKQLFEMIEAALEFNPIPGSMFIARMAVHDLRAYVESLEAERQAYRKLSDAVAELKRIEDSPEYEADGSWKDWDTAYDNMYQINRQLREKDAS